MPLFPTAPIRVQPYFGYRSATHLHISARVLRAGKAAFAKGGRLQAIRTMIAQFASHEVPDHPVTLTLTRPDGGTRAIERRADGEGFVTFDVDLPDAWPLPADTAWEIVALDWHDGTAHRGVDGHVLAPGADTALAVISDIDDTVIETGITGNVRAILRNWRRVVAQLPEERLAVPGVDHFYGALGGGAVLERTQSQTANGGRGSERLTATQRPFFYVSSSPWNLYSYLIAFMQLRKLPLGPLMLRDWGLNSATFGSGSHGAHKTAAIENILTRFGALQFALIGDDTQGDLTAYAQVVRDFPDRIAAVFIRTAGMEAFSAEEEAAKAAIEQAGVPLWLGKDYATGKAFLQAAGIAGEPEAERVMELVESGDNRPDGMEKYHDDEA